MKSKDNTTFANGSSRAASVMASEMYAFAFDTDLLSVIDTGWDIDVKVLVNAVVSAATAGFASVFDIFLLGLQILISLL